MAQQANLLVPWQETLHLTPWHTIRRTPVFLKWEDAHYMSGGGNDIAKSLTKAQLEAISSAGNMSIISSAPLPSREGESENVLRWQIAAEVEGADGKPRRIVKTYELDLRLKEIDGVDGGHIIMARDRCRKNEKKAKKDPEKNLKAGMPPVNAPQEDWDKWVEDQAMEDWVMVNRHRTARAETGATLRAIRSVYSIKSTYKQPEFAMPWVIYRAEFDATKAIAAGGPVAAMALQAAAVAMTRGLGLSEGYAMKMIESMASQPPDPKFAPPDDLVPLDDAGLAEVDALLKSAGFKNSTDYDKWTEELFGYPASQLTKRHVNLIREYIELRKLAAENITDREELEEYRKHAAGIVNLAYAQGTTMEQEMEQSWWDAIHGIVEQEPGPDPEPVEKDPFDELQSVFLGA